MSGVAYYVWVRVDWYEKRFDRSGFDIYPKDLNADRAYAAVGPINGLRYESHPQYHVLVANGQDTYHFGTNSGFKVPTSGSIVQIRRIDFQPDTGGDPPGEKQSYSPPSPRRPPTYNFNIDNRTQNFYSPSPAPKAPPPPTTFGRPSGAPGGTTPSSAPGGASSPKPSSSPGGASAPNGAPAPTGPGWGYPQPAPPPAPGFIGGPQIAGPGTNYAPPPPLWFPPAWFPTTNTGTDTKNAPFSKRTDYTGAGAAPTPTNNNGFDPTTELRNRLFPPPLIFPPPIGEKITDGSKPGPTATEKPKTGPVTQSPPSNCRNPGSCSGKILNGQDALNRKQNDLLDKLNAGLQIPELGLLKIIDSKLGPQLPNGGISSFMQRAWKATHLDKALNAINTLLLLHNAALLSRNLVETLSELTSQALSVIGIKDENDNPIDIHGILGDRLEGLARNVLGNEVYEGVAETWHKASRVTSAAANIIWSVRSIADSTQEIAEWTAENTGKIGNALKRFRIVPQNAYGWMSENVNAQSGIRRKFTKVRDGIDSLDDAASSLSGALGEVQSVQDEFGEWDDNQKRFTDELKTLVPKEREDNQPELELAEERETDSQSPNSLADTKRMRGNSQ